jgi:multidrug resistance efflux pump
MADIKHEAPSQRMHYRITVPITIGIGQKKYKSADWSMGGFRIEDIDGPFQSGTVIDCTVSVNFQGYAITFDQKARVVRYDSENKTLATEFVDMDERTREVLAYFSQGLVSGEMGTAGEAIRRIDTPVTPTELSGEPKGEKIPAKRRISRVLIGAVYLTLGLAITIYIGITLYSTIFRVQVDSGVVSAHVEPLISPQDGILEKVIVPDDGRVEKGDPIIMLYNAKQMEAVRMAEVAVEAARHRFENLRERLSAEDVTIGIYRKVGDSRLRAARDRVETYNEELQLARAELERKRELLDKGVLSRSEVEREQQRVTIIQRDLLEARAELQLAKDAYNALKKGLFFSGNQVEGETLALQAQVDAARKEVEIEQKRLEVARDQLKKYMLRAPFDGTVVKVFKTVGNTVKTGEQIAMIEEHEDRFVTAYLTQDEVENARLGDNALVFIPALDLRVDGRVVMIDRTTGFVNEMEGRFQWRSTQDRSAVAIVEFDDPERPGLNRSVPAGLPAVVNFRRVASSELFSGIFTMLGIENERTIEIRDADKARKNIYNAPVNPNPDRLRGTRPEQ